MAPPLAINKFDIFFGIWPIMVSSLSTAMAYLSTSLNSLLQSYIFVNVITLHAGFHFVHCHASFLTTHT